MATFVAALRQAAVEERAKAVRDGDAAAGLVALSTATTCNLILREFNRLPLATPTAPLASELIQ